MSQGGLSFPEAVRELAQSYGVPLPRAEFSPEERRRHQRREKKYRLLAQAAEFFTARLWSRAGSPARAYLLERGIPTKVAKRFSLGWAEEGWDGLLSHFKRNGVGPEALEEAGLVSPRRSGQGHYDRFRGRLIFPIRDHQGRVAAFGGRTISPGKEPKYLNSPETETFKKGRILYGFHEALPALRRRRRMVVVEGYLDCLSLASFGLEEVVATMGTSLTGTQVKAMRGLGLEVVLVYDGDLAGLKAAQRAQEVFHTEGVQALIASLPAGQDPDDYVRARGLEAFEEELSRAKPMDGFVIDAILDRPLATPEDKAAVVRELAPVLARISSPVAQADYIRLVAGRLGVVQEVVLSSLSRTRTAGGSRTRTESLVRRIKDQEGIKPDRRFLAALVNTPACRSALLSAGLEGILTDPLCRKVAEEAARLTEHDPDWDPARLIDQLEGPETELVVSLLEEVEIEDETAYTGELVARVERLNRENLKSDIRRRAAEADRAGDWEENKRLMKMLSSMARGEFPDNKTSGGR
jgi:DNA primase